MLLLAIGHYGTAIYDFSMTFRSGPKASHCFPRLHRISFRGALSLSWIARRTIEGPARDARVIEKTQLPPGRRSRLPSSRLPARSVRPFEPLPLTPSRNLRWISSRRAVRSVTTCAIGLYEADATLIVLSSAVPNRP